MDDARWAAFCAKREGIEREEQRLKNSWVRPGTPQGDAIAERFGSPLARSTTCSICSLVPKSIIRA